LTSATNIKVIIMDLDRTLLHTDKTLSAYTVEILKECKRHDIKIVVATARPLRATKQYCDLLDFDAMVVSNGARMIWGNQQIDYGITQKSAEHLLDALQDDPNLRITLETGDCAYSSQPIEDYETIVTDNLVSIARKEGILKILVHLDCKDALPFVQKILTEDLYYTVAHGYLLQIMNKSATKWKGIKAILDIYNYSPDETAYFGDDQDDIEPIKRCGLGIAVSNAIDEVKHAADFIAKNNDDDGVAKYIKQYIL